MFTMHTDRWPSIDAAAKRRIEVEEKIAKRCVRDLLKAGYSLAIDNGGDDNESTPPMRSFKAVMAAMSDTDDEYLFVFNSHQKSKKPFGWVRFVYGNDGWDVISDYTTNLENVLGPVCDYAQTFC